MTGPPPRSDAERAAAAQGALAHALGAPAARARVRAVPEDFQVDEILGYGPDGEGEHQLLRVRKRGANTEWVARGLARHAGVGPGAVGFAGLKDRDARCTQWFSVHLGGRPEPDWGALAGEEFEVLEARRHRRKLRRGGLAGNRFTLRLREVAGGGREDLEARLARIAERGVPNYFGEQRFGLGAANLARADALLRGARVPDRHKRGLYLSAARSALFNLVLSERVGDGTWAAALPGDVMNLEGSRSIFPAPAPDAEIRRRVAELDLHPSGPLWGAGESPAAGEALALETRVLEPWQAWREGLERAGLRHERRALRLAVRELAWDWEGDQALVLGFRLGAGSYATAVLRELVGAPAGG